MEHLHESEDVHSAAIYPPAKRKIPAVHDPAEWELYKDVLHERFIVKNETLDSVARYMREQHGFEASKQQYERKFKTWRFVKNLKKRDWVPYAELSKRGLLELEDIRFAQITLPPKRIKQALSRYKHEQPRLDPNLSRDEPKPSKSLTVEFVLKKIILMILDHELQSWKCSLERDTAAAEYLASIPQPQFDQICQGRVTIHHIRDLPSCMLKHCTSASLDEDQNCFASKVRHLRSEKAFFENHLFEITASRSQKHSSRNFSFRRCCATLKPAFDRFIIDITQMTSASQVLFGMLCAVVFTSSAHLEATRAIVDYPKHDNLFEMRSLIGKACNYFPEALLADLFSRAVFTESYDACTIYVGLGVDINATRRNSPLAGSKLLTPLQEVIQGLPWITDAIQWQNLVDQLLRCGASPNHCGEHMHLPHVPCCDGAPICQILTSASDILNRRVLCYKEFSALVKKFLQYGAKVPPSFDLTKAIANLSLCSEAVDVEMISALIAAGASAEGAADPWHGAKHFCPLQIALIRKDRDLTICLLKYLRGLPLGCSQRKIESVIRRRLKHDKARRDVAGKYEYLSPLALAITFDLDIAQKLIHMGADINSSYIDELGKSFKYFQKEFKKLVFYQNDFKPFRPLQIDQSIVFETHISGILTPLSAAINANNIEAVQMALDAGAKPCQNFDWPPLVLAATKGNYEITKLLLNNEAKLDIASPGIFSLPKHPTSKRFCSMSPLAIASATGHISMVRLFLEAGADVNYWATYSCLTPLEAAIVNDQRDIIDLLLADPRIDLGWKMRFPGRGCIRPLFLAMSTKNMKLCTQLLSDFSRIQDASPDEFGILKDTFREKSDAPGEPTSFEWLELLLTIYESLENDMSVSRIPRELQELAKKARLEFPLPTNGSSNDLYLPIPFNNDGLVAVMSHQQRKARRRVST